MPSQFLSSFGMYDFYGKSLPGMALAVGLTVLLPFNSLPEVTLADNFLIFIALLTVLGLIGILLGEIVHTISNFFEIMWAWIGRQVRSLGIKFGLGPPKSGYQPEVRNDGNDSIEGDSNVELPTKTLRYRAFHKIHQWVYSQYQKLFYIIASHRRVFLKELTGDVEIPYQTVDLPLTNASFARQHLVKKSIEEFDMKSKEDAREVYSIVVSRLTFAGCERPFRYQARYSFCRSMWMVLSFLSGIYIFGQSWSIFSDILQFEESYLREYLHTTDVILLGIGLLFISLIFAIASGAYKRHYVRYLISEIYMLDRMESKDKNRTQPVQRGS